MIGQTHDEKYIFISYKAEERATAEKFKNALENAGVKVWIAPESIPLGSNYVKSIANAIRGSAAVLVLLSEKSQNSEWVQSEVGMAKDSRIQIFPVRIENSEITDEFRLLIGIRQTVDCFDDPRPVIGHVLNLLGRDNLTQTQVETQKDETEKKPLAPRAEYVPPPIELLKEYEFVEPSWEDTAERSRAVENLVADILMYGANKDAKERIREHVKVVNVVIGPQASRYEVTVPSGVNPGLLEMRADTFAYELAVSGVRVQMPVWNKNAVAIEIPNSVRSVVGLREVLRFEEFNNDKSACEFAVGKNLFGKAVTCDLNKSPHFLVGGQVGSGKSACLNSLIVSLMYRYGPEDVKFLLIDTKRVEFSLYVGMPHMLFENVITDEEHAANALEWAIEEIYGRFKDFERADCNSISAYNAVAAESKTGRNKYPHIVIVIDEFADLMMSRYADDIKSRIGKIASVGRAAGVHLIIATMRPSADILPGSIKACVIGRMALRTSSTIDSRVILNDGGAETLTGSGDMLFLSYNMNRAERVQGAFIDRDEIIATVDYLKKHVACVFDKKAEKKIFRDSDTSEVDIDNADADPLVSKVLSEAMRLGRASISYIQHRFMIGYARAARMVDWLETHGCIGPMTGNGKPREVLITHERFREMFGHYPEEE